MQVFDIEMLSVTHPVIGEHISTRQLNEIILRRPLTYVEIFNLSLLRLPLLVHYDFANGPVPSSWGVELSPGVIKRHFDFLHMGLRVSSIHGVNTGMEIRYTTDLFMIRDPIAS